jgi:hypothetical protein
MEINRAAPGEIPPHPFTFPVCKGTGFERLGIDFLPSQGNSMLSPVPQ